MAHYAQGIRDDTFAKYDYGCSCLEALGINTLVRASTLDTFATSTDVEQLRSGLPSDTIVYEQTIDAFSHLDFTWAQNANDLVYQDMLVQLDKYTGVGY
ncbi:Lipase [Phytophthora megakarya]|uniref:Lipase n=1 Tax=Phytophthora megakarya TaxID=4795 RepID=A0A225WXF4_9STRA|nr:Lipase [Phytophthora megakarya]